MKTGIKYGMLLLGAFALAIWAGLLAEKFIKHGMNGVNLGTAIFLSNCSFWLVKESIEQLKKS